MPEYTKATMFEESAARRIAEAVKRYEQEKNFGGEESIGSDEVVFARIDSDEGSGYYTATQVYYQGDSAQWVDVPDGMTWGSDSNDVGTLFEASGNLYVDQDSVQCLKIAFQDDGEPQWVFFDNAGGIDELFNHPFKVTYTGIGNDYYIGAERSSPTYQFKDLIHIHDLDESKVYTIEKSTPEYVTGPGSIVGQGPIIYYRLERTETGAQPWDAVVVTEATWPPAAMEDNQDAIYVPIAQMMQGGGKGQLQFSDIMVWVRPQQPSFSAFRYNGGVVISGGIVYNSLNQATTVAGATVADGGTLSAWVEIDIAPGAAPVVNATVQTGAWPGYEDEVAGTLTRRIRLGTFSNQLWTPNHVGHIHLGTLFQPDIPADAQYNDGQGYKNIAGSSTSVGATKDLFFDGRVLGIDILGGDFEDISDIGALKWGGTSADIAQIIVTGATKTGDSEITFTRSLFTLDTDRGLVQTNTLAGEADIVIQLEGGSQTLNEGPGIDIALESDGSATITSLLDDDGSGVVITDGAAGAPHIASLDYSVIWGNVVGQNGVTKTVLADVITLEGDIAWVNTNIGVKDSIVKDALDGNKLHLDGDEAVPGDFELYGQGLAAGGKGWKSVADLCDNTFSIARSFPGGGLGTTFDVIFTVDSSVETTATGVELHNDVNVPSDYSIYGFRYAADEKAWSQIHLFFQDSDTVSITAPTGGPSGACELEVISQLSITDDTAGIKLVNDEDTPGNDEFYGTGHTGTKGWRPFSDMVKESIELDTDGKLHLDGDEATPDAWDFYGKNASAKGWQAAQTITVITDIQLSSNNLQVKTRQIRAFDLQTESGWTTITGWATTSCP